MELKTASQVSKTLGISAQMLRYYERCGLMESLRKDDYAYRVYDFDNIKRLQQIVILRKLQIPIKQIAVILNSMDASAALEVFKENISAHENEITALETIKAALEILVDKIEQLADLRLNMNVLTDESMMELAQSLSLTQKNIKENVIMNELDRVSEAIKEKHARKLLIRYVNMRPMRVLSTYIKGTNRTDNFHKSEYTEKEWVKAYDQLLEKHKQATDEEFTEYYGEYFEGHSEAGHILTKRIPENCVNDSPYEDYFLGGFFIVETSTDNFAGYDPVALYEAMKEWLNQCDYLEIDDSTAGGDRDPVYGCVTNNIDGGMPGVGAMWDLFIPVKRKHL